MKLSIITIAILFQCFVLYSQEEISTPDNDSTYMFNEILNPIKPKAEKYVYTYSGNFFTGRNFHISKEDGIFYIAIDSFEVNLSLVKFIKYDNNFWANTNRVEQDNKNEFSLQTHQGKLNLYEKIELTKNVTHDEIFFVSNQIWSNSNTTIEKNVINYYNREFGDLKSVKYKNLSKDLSDNFASMQLLENSQTYKNRSTTFYLVGIASIIYGISGGLVNSDNSNSKITAFIPIGIWLGSIWIGSIYSKKKTKKLREAIRVY